jgi:type II secretory pathway pseudopilin PulG
VIWVAGVIGIGTLLLIVVSGIVVAMLRPTLNSTVGQALATPTVDQNRTVLETQVAVLLTQRPVLVDTPTAAVANAPVTATPDAYPGVVASQVPVASPGASPVPSPAALPAFQSTPAAAPQRQSAP